MQFIKRHHRLLFYLSWLLINLVQAYGTGLLDDEAYYWIYSQYPAWGYFDHPPMIAMLIKAGYAIFHNELGVRLFITVINVLTLFIIEKLLPRKNDFLFYLICYSIAILQIGGIIAVPDLPLTFFTALFFLTYRNFLRSDKLTNSILLGLVIALMLYSKYHGILIIFFTFLSNPRLALKATAWLSLLTATVLLLPHLYWQYANGFPSVQFHLIERNTDSFTFRFVANYIVGQILLPGPITGWLLLYAAMVYKPRDHFEKALKYSLWGIYLFFLISTSKGRVELNWTVPALVALLILSHQYLMAHPRLVRVLKKSVPFSLALVFMIRIYMMLDIRPIPFLPKDEFHESREWADSIRMKTQSRPVIFLSTYQEAAKYWFYSGVPAFSLNTPSYRRNIFNFLPLENELIGRDVAVVSPYKTQSYRDTIFTPLGVTAYKNLSAYYSFSRLHVISPAVLRLSAGENLEVGVSIVANKNELTYFRLPRYSSLPINFYIVENDSIAKTFSTGLTLAKIGREKEKFRLVVPVRLKAGTYFGGFGIPSVIDREPSLNSARIRLVVD